MTMSSLWTPTSHLQHFGMNTELQHCAGTTRSRMRQISRSARVSKCGWTPRILSIRCNVRLTYQIDEDFPLTHIAAFEPPAHRSGMRALLEHSRQTYGPLPAELRRIRSRTSSRPTPYPQPQRAVRVSSSLPRAPGHPRDSDIGRLGVLDSTSSDTTGAAATPSKSKRRCRRGVPLGDWQEG
jgi:hypothetical protein